MVQATLRELDVWYQESITTPDRPKLLSKLALLELCGWLEEELDRILLALENPVLGDAPWVSSQIIGANYGFGYERHFRGMLCKLIGEAVVRQAEKKMEQQNPGELAQLKSKLGSLWKKRCSFAHADMGANIRSQQTFDAPSWTMNEFNVIAKILEHFERVLVDVVMDS